jgi:phage shock protein E
MLGLFKNLFGNSGELEALKKKNPIILDVRTREEFSTGHAEGSENIPLSELPSRIVEIKKRNRPVITCCMSGGRSSSAAKMLQQGGVEAMNGGSWTNLK